jgi:predicted PurR-regulated permease PerM
MEPPMADEEAPEKLKDDKALPEPGDPATGPPVAVDATTPAAQTLQAAPAAVRRSMPMALSICLGILLAALGAWFFYYLTWLILLVYLSFIVATILDAPVQWLKRHGLRRGLSAVIIMVGGLGLVTSILYLAGSAIYEQVAAVSSNIERAPQRINDMVNRARSKFIPTDKRMAPGAGAAQKKAEEPVAPQPASNTTTPATQSQPAGPTTSPDDFNIAESVKKEMPGVGTIAANAMRGVEAITWMVVMFFIVLYMLVDGADHLKGTRTLLPKHMRLEATKMFNEVARAHRGWAVASLANIASSAILTSLGLWMLGVPGAVILGFIAGLGELIPNIGPIAAAVPALVLTLVAEPDKFLYVVGMFVIVQTIQSYTISPWVMKISIEMPVLVTILSVLVFGTLFGFLGVLVAIPFVADMVVVWNYIAKWRERDTEDYDMINATPDSRRAAMAPDNTPPGRLRKLFLRDRKRAIAAQETAGNGNAPAKPAAAPQKKGNGLDRLEQAENKAGGKGPT